MTRGILIAAPASGSGKTVVTLSLLRHLRNEGVAVGSIKVGPDYIDPVFHGIASGRVCYNFDSWAMRPDTLASVTERASEAADLIVGEGVMGLFDGAPGGAGSTAEVAALTGWPVVLVIDVRGMAASAAALIEGFRNHRSDVRVAGVIFNRVGGDSHMRLLEESCRSLGVRLLGGLRRDTALTLPDRHLGLVQAGEHPDLDAFLDRAATLLAEQVDVDTLRDLAQPLDGERTAKAGASSAPIPPLGQHIAVGHDVAFAFAYPYQLEAWRRAGAEVAVFSPLADEAPPKTADAVFLPGGYPELHAARLAGNDRFLEGLRTAAARGAAIYGECGGFMVLGRGLVDESGRRHAMADLLPLETSFESPRLTLGYRRVSLNCAAVLGDSGTRYSGHEFHYAQVLEEGPGQALFETEDARGARLATCGLSQGTVAGSFIHLIDRAA